MLILKPSLNSRRMKIITKNFMLISFVCLAQVISAQTVHKAALMIGGSAGFSSQKIKDADNSTTYFNLKPTVGYFFADDLALGLGVDFSSTSFNGNSNSSFSLSPFVRYYVTDPIFVQVHANIGLDDGAGTAFGAAVGYSWFLSNNVAIEPALFFTSVNNDGDAFDSTIFGLSIGIQAFANHDHGME